MKYHNTLSVIYMLVPRIIVLYVSPLHFYNQKSFDRACIICSIRIPSGNVIMTFKYDKP